jgi:hypothetical protein
VEPTLELAAQLDADRREAARAMTFEQRALAGVAQFDLCTAAMRAGIRLQNSGISAERVEEVLVDRLRNARRFEARV